MPSTVAASRRVAWTAGAGRAARAGGRVRSGAWPSPTPTPRSSPRSRTTGPTSSSICGSSTRSATSTPRRSSTQVNAQPYSKHDWHWRILIAHRFGHAASSQATHGTLNLLDDAGIDGEIVVREVRVGRFETQYLPNRPESVRQEYLKLRNQ